jgi:hypothetical protein
VVIVGDYIGSQMAAIDVDAPLGLIDHLEDGEVDVPYTKRTVVIAGNAPFTATTSGALPEGMSFDAKTGVVSGTPVASGVFSFTITASDANNPAVAKTYTFAVTEPGEVLPPHTAVDTVAAPLGAGTTTGGGICTNGVTVTVTATPAAGFAFLNWTDNGRAVSTSARYEFTTTVNRSLVANFVAAPQLSLLTPTADTLVIVWPTNYAGFALERNAVADATGWSPVANPALVVGTNYHVTITPLTGTGFFRAVRQ